MKSTIVALRLPPRTTLRTVILPWRWVAMGRVALRWRPCYLTSLPLGIETSVVRPERIYR